MLRRQVVVLLNYIIFPPRRHDQSWNEVVSPCNMRRRLSHAAHQVMFLPLPLLGFHSGRAMWYTCEQGSLNSSVTAICFSFRLARQPRLSSGPAACDMATDTVLFSISMSLEVKFTMTSALKVRILQPKFAAWLKIWDFERFNQRTHVLVFWIHHGTQI